MFPILRTPEGSDEARKRARGMGKGDIYIYMAAYIAFQGQQGSIVVEIDDGSIITMKVGLFFLRYAQKDSKREWIQALSSRGSL